MRKVHFLFLLVLVLMLAVMALPAGAQDDLPTLDDLEEGWNTIAPGGDTVCSRGTDYEFFVRKTDTTDNLMVYFQGGGACWNAFSCAQGAGFFDDSVGGIATEVGLYGGLFDFENASNPVMDYNIVFVSYCTADIHLGNSEVEYADGVTIQHAGQANSRAVLDWTFSNFPDAQNVFVTGTSAGGYGAIYYTPEIAEAYPDARITHLSDASVGVSPVNWSVWDTWNILDGAPFDFSAIEDYTGNTFFELAAASLPDIRFSQYTTTDDEVQVTFYRLSDPTGEPWTDLMYEYLGGLNEAYENFSSYIAPGDVHVILPLPIFYTLEVDGVKFVDWITALINGDPVDDVVCDPCVVEVEEGDGG